MKKSSKKQQDATVAESKPTTVVGLDLGDRHSHYCMLTSTGEVVEEGRIQTTRAAMEKHFGGEPRMRIALEAGTHSAWVSRLLKSYGHQVIVANPRKIPTLTKSESKNDRNDAEQLARMAAFDPKLLPSDRAPQPGAPAGPEPDPYPQRAGARPDDADQFRTRAGQERRRTAAHLQLRGVPARRCRRRCRRH